MFDNSALIRQNLNSQKSNQSSSQLRRQANIKFWRLHAMAAFHRSWAELRGRDFGLKSLAENRSANGKAMSGIQIVPINLIQGSEGRAADFDAEFRPLQAHTRERWVNIAVARVLGRALPPVELIQVDDIYFVRDGHHRISVARSRGQIAVDAIVTVC